MIGLAPGTQAEGPSGRQGCASSVPLTWVQRNSRCPGAGKIRTLFSLFLLKLVFLLRMPAACRLEAQRVYSYLSWQTLNWRPFYVARVRPTFKGSLV